MTDERPVAYLAGPMKGIPEYNLPAFRYYGDELNEIGYKVLSPLTIFGGATDLDMEKYLRGELAALLKSDVMFVLEGWEYSNGTNFEILNALAIGLKVWTYPEYQPVTACCILPWNGVPPTGKDV